VVTRRLQAEHRTGSFRRPKTSIPQPTHVFLLEENFTSENLPVVFSDATKVAF